MPILTIVTPEPKPEFDLWIKKSYPDIAIEHRHIIDDRAVEWVISQSLHKDILDKIRAEHKVDIFQFEKKPNIRLFVADMDSTIVSGETLDDMAEIAGIGDKIAAITERAMKGELDFEEALRERVNMLAGQPASLIDQTLDALRYNKGAKELLLHLKSKDIYCVLISGGFTQFTTIVADKLGFDDHFGNQLVMAPRTIESKYRLPFLGQTDPLVIPPDNMTFFTGEVKTPILDKMFKRDKLLQLQSDMGLKNNQTMAIGDGANDLPMLQAAGLGVGYHGKPLLKEALENRIDYTDLRSLIYIL